MRETDRVLTWERDTASEFIDQHVKGHLFCTGSFEAPLTMRMSSFCDYFILLPWSSFLRWATIFDHGWNCRWTLFQSFLGVMRPHTKDDGAESDVGAVKFFQIPHPHKIIKAIRISCLKERRDLK